jgi:hypothetical protein
MKYITIGECQLYSFTQSMIERGENTGLINKLLELEIYFSITLYKTFLDKQQKKKRQTKATNNGKWRYRQQKYRNIIGNRQTVDEG